MTASATRWTGRIAGLDLARAVALVGMFAAHIGDSGTRGGDTHGWHWLWIADGRASAIFAVLAGVTIALMAARDPVGPAHTAVRVATRGIALMGAGYALSAFHTPVIVILTNLGLMFLLVLPFVRARAPMLLAAAAVALTAGAIASRALSGGLDGVPVLEKLVSAHYPALAWVGYVLVGMAVGRADLRVPKAALALAWKGAMVAAFSYGSGVALGGPAPWEGAHWDADANWASVAPHANTPFELVGNTGVALMVIGLCVAAARGPTLLYPVLAFGSMSLTMYTAHVIIIAAAGTPLVWHPSNVALVAMTLGLIGAATVWRLVAGTGPLERALTWASTKVADATVRRQE